MEVGDICHGINTTVDFFTIQVLILNKFQMNECVDFGKKSLLFNVINQTQHIAFLIYTFNYFDLGVIALGSITACKEVINASSNE